MLLKTNLLVLAAPCIINGPMHAAPILDKLRAGHPRLIATADDWERLRADPSLGKFLAELEQRGRKLLDAPPVTYQKTGRRLLAVSRDALDRILLLSFNFQVTGDDVFACRAVAEMEAVAAFDDWNPSHFLDVAEMTAALALGYDWLFDTLSPETRRVIRRALVDKGLRAALSDEKAWWRTSQNNWNQVCWGGLTLGALAIADEETDLAGEILRLARENSRHGMAPYRPDGVYPEGPSYWEYGTTYSVLMISALETALGTDWQIPASEGFLASAIFHVQSTGPGGSIYNFGDGSSEASFSPALFWMARRLDQPGLLHFQKQLDRRTGRFAPLAAIWWPRASASLSGLPIAWLGHGENPLAMFRSSWTDPDALYLALKGGSASLSHAHMDAGSFILEADGVRWACDLGAQDYDSLESKDIKLWDRGQDGDRWKVFRLNNRSHSTLTINGQLHHAKGHARIVRFSADDPHAVVDLTETFKGQADKVIRGFRLLPNRGVLIQDDLRGLAPGTKVRWAMVTEAEVECDGRTAILRQDGKTLHASLLESATAAFTVISGDPPADDFNAPNPGIRLLLAEVEAPESGEMRIGILLSPGGKSGAVRMTSPEGWSAPLHE